MNLEKEVELLREQCAAWEKMYNEDTSNLIAERDRLKHQLEIATSNASAMTEKAEAAQRQLRHV